MRAVITSLAAHTVYLCTLPISLAADSHISEADLLFQCSVNDGANAVEVVLLAESVDYFFFDADGRVELFITSPLSTVDYTPFAWSGPDVTESITFHNGETSYHVFSTMIRSGANFINGSIGGVVVTTPSGQRTEIICDPNSVAPINVFQGIGRLAVLRDENYDAFQQCLLSDLSATACTNVQVATCGFELNDTNICLSAEYDRWQAVLAQRLSKTDELDNAQNLWEASRDADCQLSAWVIYNPFEGEEGMLSCLSDYTARRVDFVDEYLYGLEFDG